jgi:hypothetical protein
MQIKKPIRNLLVLIGLFPNLIYAQKDAFLAPYYQLNNASRDSPINILQAQPILDNYYKEHPDKGEGGLNSQYQIWNSYWAARVNGATGNIGDMQNVYKDFIINTPTYCTNSTVYPSNWSSMGPANSDQLRGRANQVWVDPTDETHIIMGTWGGVWELPGGSDTWKCISDNPLGSLPSLNINAMDINPLASGTYDISIGTSDIDGVSIGVANRNRATKAWSYDENLQSAYVLATTGWILSSK